MTTFKSPILGLDPIVLSKYETYSHDPVSFVNFSFSRLSLLYKNILLSDNILEKRRPVVDRRFKILKRSCAELPKYHSTSEKTKFPLPS